jgi:hypothetical protein
MLYQEKSGNPDLMWRILRDFHTGMIKSAEINTTKTIAQFSSIGHRNLRTRRRMSSQKLTISLVKQAKFKVGVVQADGLGRLLIYKTFFAFIKWWSRAMSSGADLIVRHAFMHSPSSS